ncbi:MAG: hypothetical protein AAGA27_05480, partial [Pseudomonadota bacterium]
YPYNQYLKAYQQAKTDLNKIKIPEFINFFRKQRMLADDFIRKNCSDNLNITSSIKKKIMLFYSREMEFTVLFSLSLATSNLVKKYIKFSPNLPNSSTYNKLGTQYNEERLAGARNKTNTPTFRFKYKQLDNTSFNELGNVQYANFRNIYSALYKYEMLYKKNFPYGNCVEICEFAIAILSMIDIDSKIFIPMPVYVTWIKISNGDDMFNLNYKDHHFLLIHKSKKLANTKIIGYSLQSLWNIHLKRLPNCFVWDGWIDTLAITDDIHEYINILKQRGVRKYYYGTIKETYTIDLSKQVFKHFPYAKKRFHNLSQEFIKLYHKQLNSLLDSDEKLTKAIKYAFKGQKMTKLNLKTEKSK